MAYNIRYDSKTWLSRPTTQTWKVIKPYIGWPAGSIDMSLPPKFGHCIDVLREKYGIYISVVPHLKVTDSPDNDKKLAFHFFGTCIVMEDMGKITDEYCFTGQEFPPIMNSALLKAIEYLKKKS